MKLTKTLVFAILLTLVYFIPATATNAIIGYTEDSEEIILWRNYKVSEVFGLWKDGDKARIVGVNSKHLYSVKKIKNNNKLGVIVVVDSDTSNDIIKDTLKLNKFTTGDNGNAPVILVVGDRHFISGYITVFYDKDPNIVEQTPELRIYLRDTYNTNTDAQATILDTDKELEKGIPEWLEKIVNSGTNATIPNLLTRGNSYYDNNVRTPTYVSPNLKDSMQGVFQVEDGSAFYAQHEQSITDIKEDLGFMARFKTLTTIGTARLLLGILMTVIGSFLLVATLFDTLRGTKMVYKLTYGGLMVVEDTSTIDTLSQTGTDNQTHLVTPLKMMYYIGLIYIVGTLIALGKLSFIFNIINYIKHVLTIQT